MDPEAALSDNHLAEAVTVRRRSQSFSDDYSVQRTNDDATQCKFSAIQLQYWTDPFIKKFTSGVETNSRKDPEIHIGYWARVTAVYQAVSDFIEATKGNCQIISLGSGFDTLYWRLKEAKKPFIKFIDIDFSSVTARKIRHIRKANSDLMEYFTQAPQEEQHCDLHCGDYHLIGADIRQWEELNSKLNSTQLDKELPTFFLAECVLIYMSANHSSNLLKNIAQNFSTGVFLNYEQFRTSDQFGKIMEKNLEKRGLQLPGLSAAESFDSQKQRFIDAGWNSVSVKDMDNIYQSLSKTERTRIEAIERLDEMELLHQLLEHYCIVYAVLDKTGKWTDILSWKIH